MKALIGLDHFQDADPALELFARLGFEDCRVRVAHSMEYIFPIFVSPMPVMAASHTSLSAFPIPTEVTQALETRASSALEKARSKLYESGIHSDTKLLHGNPADQLILEAEEMGADLIAAASTTRGVIECAMLNSVCRALTIGAKTSVLIAKKKPHEGKPLTVVYATDLSDYNLRGLELLLKMRPMGIQRITVLVAVPPLSQRFGPAWDGAFSYYETEAVDKKQIQKDCEAIVKKLEPLNLEAEYKIAFETAEEAINAAMRKHHADLLIVAAQGHGFIERLGLGSVSLHEAVAEPHSLLILRP